MSRHQIVVEVDTDNVPDDKEGTAYLLMLHLGDVAEDRGWQVTDLFIQQAPEDDE